MSVEELMDQIVKMDVKPDIFKLFLMRTDHTFGYNAWVDFRVNDTNPNNLKGLSAHADSAEEALKNLRDELSERFGKCDFCGGYRGSRRES